MIHNAWIRASGDRNDFIEYSEYLAPFDASMAQLYADIGSIGKILYSIDGKQANKASLLSIDLIGVRAGGVSHLLHC